MDGAGGICGCLQVRGLLGSGLRGCVQHGCVRLEPGCVLRGCVLRGCVQHGCVRLEPGCVLRGCVQHACVHCLCPALHGPTTEPVPPTMRVPSALCRQYGKDYVPLEEAAQAAKRGIWSGTFEVPAKWRQSHPRSDSKAAPTAAATATVAPAAVVASAAGGAPGAAAAVAAQPPPGCAIKGNITAKGEKIYHVPGASAGDCCRCFGCEEITGTTGSGALRHALRPHPCVRLPCHPPGSNAVLCLALPHRRRQLLRAHQDRAREGRALLLLCGGGGGSWLAPLPLLGSMAEGRQCWQLDG